ncbi:major capsid protein [Bacillus sp. J14TS2]|uniref:phage major capsid family protein n=1 Tax=Bacillus sp. J14TS2 TaxID=2807188 RepID=UPI001B111340|nr:phage major capsid protein [Bacillus sp. J14TS2]GIN74025.1 major capsid protein [Bacillus sp. J14TS2]
MTIKLNGKMENFKAKKETYTKLLKDENATPEQLQNAVDEMFVALQEDLTEKITADARNSSLDTQVLVSRGSHVLTSEETAFYNKVVEDGGFNDESIFPESVQDRIFEGLVKDRPLLQAIGLQDLGAVTKFIYSDPTLAYAWKEIFGDISGQVNNAFRDEKITQLKLTAFGAIPNDMLELGPVWVDRYMVTLLIESLAAGLEYGLVNGRGPAQDEPIGLLKDVDPETGAVTDKKSSGKLTFAPSERGEVVVGELYGMLSKLSKDAKGKYRKVLNKVVMFVNPIDLLAVNARHTIQNDAGQFVTNLPYNIKPVDSEEIPAGKVAFLVQGEYIAAIAGAYKLKKFDQTLAIEDALLYTIKRFANGRPKDNQAVLVYDLDIQFPVPSEETP